MRIKWKLTVASLKMFFRQREAIVWTLLLPLFIIFLFGLIHFDGLGRIDLGVVNGAGQGGARLLESLNSVKTFKIDVGTEQDELQMLEKGERDMVLLIPPGFEQGGAPDSMIAFTNDEKVQEAQLGALVLQRALDEKFFARAAVSGRVMVKTKPVRSRNLNYIDFLIPGVIGVSIMQMGIFGVAFGFVSLKKRGILRRLWVTPIHPSDFIIAQVITRVIVVMLQMGLLVGVGMLFLHLHFVGSLLALSVVAILGAVVFLSFGFALAGMSKSEDQVAPIANIINLPMMLLSGVFFSRSHLPGFVHTVTGFFPLTYLADGLRSVAIDGASLWQVGPQLIGLAVWCVISVTIAIRLFRWE